MQPTAAIIASAEDLERDRAWLVVANRHWSAGTITADEFAMRAVGRLLLQDIATAPHKMGSRHVGSQLSAAAASLGIPRRAVLLPS